MSVQVESQMVLPGVLKRDIVKRPYHDFVFPHFDRRPLLLFIDSLLVMLSAGGAILLWRPAANWASAISTIEAYWYWFPIMLVGWWALAWLNDLYDIPSSNNRVSSAMRVIIVSALILGIYQVLSYLELRAPSRVFVFYFVLIALPSIALWRWMVAIVFNTAPFRHRVLVIGEDEEKRFIANALKQHPANYLVMGYADLPYLLRQRRIHEIVVAGNTKPELESNLFQLLSDCRAEGVRVSQVPDLYERLYHSTPIKYIDSSWALGAVQHLPVFGFLPTAVKRLMDVVLGLAGLLVFMLVLPVVALAIRLDSPGAIFYRQIRCGRAGKPFSIIKFRTMYSDAEKDGRPRWATRNDDRITRVGRFLRKTRLDEVPQVINVLLGEMSVIGPRPERPEFVKDLQQSIPFYRTRLMVKPGLTGWAQINYPYGNTVDDALIKLQYDFYHLRHWSVWLDLYILFRTFSVMLRFKGT